VAGTRVHSLRNCSDSISKPIAMPLDSFGLGPERSSTKITYDEFIDLCSKYGVQDRETYENLDYFRLKSIPEILQQRRLEGCPFLEKTELQILVEWRR